MTERELTNALSDLLEWTLDADDDEPLAEFAEPLKTIERITTFHDAGLLTSNAGLVIKTADGREFQITVVRSR